MTTANELRTGVKNPMEFKASTYVDVIKLHPAVFFLHPPAPRGLIQDF
jgi:hypothetical protein